MSEIQSLMESYLKIKNNEPNAFEKTTLGYFILNLNRKSLIFKQNRESKIIIHQHIEEDFITFSDSISTNDKGLSDYPIGFSISTKQRKYILYSTLNIYTKWILHLKEFFRILDKKLDFDYKDDNINKEKLIKDINKAKNKNTNAEQLFINNNKIGLNDKEFNNVLEGFDKNLDKSLKDQDRMNHKFSNDLNNINLNDKKNKIIVDNEKTKPLQNFITDDQKKVKNMSRENHLNTKNQIKVANANSTIPNNILDEGKDSGVSININRKTEKFSKSPAKRRLIELNNEWDKDFYDLRENLANLKKENEKRSFSPTKKKDLTDEIKNIKSLNSIKNDHNIHHSKNYKRDIIIYDNPSLHIKQSVSEDVKPENLHFGKAKIINDEIYLKEKSKFSKKPSNLGNLEKYIIDNPINERQIVQNDDNTFTFSIKITDK